MPVASIARVLAVSLLGLTSGPPSLRAEPGSPVTCRIALASTADDLTLTAVTQPKGTVQARYRFSVTKRDAAGQSLNIQSGAVATEPGQQQTLAIVTFPASARGHVEADLQITWDRGQTSCSFP